MMFTADNVPDLTWIVLIGFFALTAGLDWSIRKLIVWQHRRQYREQHRLTRTAYF